MRRLRKEQFAVPTETEPSLHRPSQGRLYCPRFLVFAAARPSLDLWDQIHNFSSALSRKSNSGGKLIGIIDKLESSIHKEVHTGIDTR